MSKIVISGPEDLEGIRHVKTLESLLDNALDETVRAQAAEADVLGKLGLMTADRDFYRNSARWGWLAAAVIGGCAVILGAALVMVVTR